VRLRHKCDWAPDRATELLSSTSPVRNGESANASIRPCLHPQPNACRQPGAAGRDTADTACGNRIRSEERRVGTACESRGGEDGGRDDLVTGVQTCARPICETSA